ncbi:hypothetical protein DEO72_LG7g4 [Vigna unguiculata]|uniref:Uncharacterized protein n=1 Tax=Vigna unguiculata TaxID=3917 RepID=A0A4D6MCK8_VIGUN|nr:hypothetical protein DEO72_LG7g4 [Vigna unguiculata]
MHCVWASPIKPNFIVNKNLVSLRQVVAANSIIVVVTFIQIPKPTARLIPSFLSHSLLLVLHHPRFGKSEESTLVSPPPTSLAKKHEGRVQAIHGVSFLLHRDIHHVAGRGSSATIGLRLTNDFDRHDHHEHSYGVCVVVVPVTGSTS